MRQAAASLGKQFDTLAKGSMGLGTALGGLGTALTVAQLLNYAQAWTKVQNQLKLVTASTEDLRKTTAGLYGIAQATTSSFDSTANLYARLARVTADLGLTQKELYTITTAINQAFTVSGTSGDEAKAAIIQLSQGFAAGALRGDELNSVMEQAPRLARALADGLGVGLGALRKMGEEGKLTADKLSMALLSQAPKIGEEYGKMTKTIGNGFDVVSNAVERGIGALDKVLGVSETLTAGLLRMAAGIDAITDALERQKGRKLTLPPGYTTSAERGFFNDKPRSLVGPAVGADSLTVVTRKLSLGAPPVTSVSADALYQAIEQIVVEGGEKVAEALKTKVTTRSLSPAFVQLVTDQISTTAATMLAREIELLRAGNAYAGAARGAPSSIRRGTPDRGPMTAEMAQVLRAGAQEYDFGPNYDQRRAEGMARNAERDAQAVDQVTQALGRHRHLLQQQQAHLAGLAGLLGKVNPALGGLASSVLSLRQSLQTGDSFGAAIAGAGILIDTIVAFGDASLQAAADLKRAQEELRRTQQSAFDVAARVFPNEVRQAREGRTGFVGTAFERSAGMGNLRLESFAAFLSQLGALPTTGGMLEELTKKSGGYSSSYKTYLQGLFETDNLEAFTRALIDAFGPNATFLDIASQALEDMGVTVDNLSRSAKVAVDGIGDLAAIVASEKFQGDIVGARSQLSRSFAAAGGDIFEQRKAQAVFEEVLQGIKASATLARSRAGGGASVGHSGTPGAAKSADGGSAPGGGVSFDQPASPGSWEATLRLPDPSTRIVVPYADAIDFQKLVVSEWAQLVTWANPPPLAPVTVNAGGARDIVRLSRFVVDDWSDLLYFPALPAPVAPITINAGGNRDLVRITRMTIDDWSDILDFPNLPARLQPIMIGVEGRGGVGLEHDRDMIRIRPLTIDDWSDLLNFPSLPALLQPIMIGVEGRRGVGLEHDRDMIRIRPLTIDDWSDILTFASLPAPLQPITVNTGGPRDLISLTPYRVTSWGQMFTFGGDVSAGAPPTTARITVRGAELLSITKSSLEINSILGVTGKLNVALADYINFDGGGLREKLFRAVEQGIADRQIRIRAN